jgi:hypothetical protein
MERAVKTAWKAWKKYVLMNLSTQLSSQPQWAPEHPFRLKEV